jgi:5'-nucleotidase
LQARVAQSDFVWLHGNVAPAPCPDGRPGLLGVNLQQARLLEVGGIRVGVFGLTIDSVHPAIEVLDPLAVATALTADLRRRGAEIVVALTHLSHEDDLRIYQALRGQGLDVIIGGHDHEHMQLPAEAPRIFKADADAATAWVVTLRLPAGGPLRVEAALREMGSAIRPDPVVAGHVAGWVRRHETAFCAGEQRPPDCLREPLGTTTTPFVAEEERIRFAETSAGNWITDVMRTAFDACGAGSAIINAGSLRLNHDLPAGTVITRRHVEELMQFPTPLYLVELTGDQLARAVANGVSQPGAGRWLQVSGLAFVHDPATRRVARLFARPAGGQAPVDALANPAQRFRVVVSEYLTIGPEDGYVGILPRVSEALPCPASGTDLKALVYETLRAQRAIGPRPEGRVCTTRQAAEGGCQAEAWSRGPR